MVKFGRHIQFYLENEYDGNNLYIVPYNNLRDEFISACSSKSITQNIINKFESRVRSCIHEASVDFQHAMTNVWSRVFEKLTSTSDEPPKESTVDKSEVRGATPDLALQLYISRASVDESKELLKIVRDIHAAALINAEALRKIIKKIEKQVQKEAQQNKSQRYLSQKDETSGDDIITSYDDADDNDKNCLPAKEKTSLCGRSLSAKLLPEVYAANFTIGQSTLEAGLTLLRSKLHLDDDDDHDENNENSTSIHHDQSDLSQNGAIKKSTDLHAIHTNPWEHDENYPKDHLHLLHSHPHSTKTSLLNEQSRVDSHSELISRRKSEFEWLRCMISSCSKTEISHLVAHRGFHSLHDRNDRRPLENSLTAYEAAWTSGIKLCECDIALTKDEKLILAHDDDYSRLALDPHSHLSKCRVSDLTFREIMSLPLKSGSRPPLLIDVLRSARAIGDDCQLIIEIKPGNSEAATALARMFFRHPELMECCAVVMSFDVFAMHNLRRELKVWTSTSSKGGLGRDMRASISIPTAMSLGNIYDINSLLDDEKKDTTAANGHVSSSFIPGSSERENENSSGVCFGYQHNTHDSSDHFGVGLSTSFGNLRQDSFHFTPFQGTSNGVEITTATGTISSGDRITAQSPQKSTTGEHIFHAHDTGRSANETEKKIVTMTSITRGKRKVPKLMLLTVANPPQKPCKLWVDVKDLSSVHKWVKSNDGNLDGVYLQFQHEMLSSKGSHEMRRTLKSPLLQHNSLGENGFCFGVWGLSGHDPDDFETFQKLVTDCGVSYVNSDLPRTFKT